MVQENNAVSEDLPDINLRNNQTEISMSISQEKIKNDAKVVSAGGAVHQQDNISAANSVSVS